MADMGTPKKPGGNSGVPKNSAGVNSPKNKGDNSQNQNSQNQKGNNSSPQSQGAKEGGDLPNRGFDLKSSGEAKKSAGIPGKGALGGAIANAAANSDGAAGKAARGAQKAVEVGKKVVNVVSKGGKAVSQLVGILANPATWIVLAVVIVVIAALMGSIAALQTIGKNDTSDGCYGIGKNSGASTIVFEEDDSAEERADKMMTWLLEQPSWEVNDGGALTKEQAAAIVGNFMAESQMAPDTIELSAPNREHYLKADNDRIDVWTQENSARKINIGLGIAQWTWNPGRAGGLIKKARETGTQWYEIEPQLEFMKEEMNGAYAAGLKARGFTDDSNLSLAELSSGFHDVYEVSADDEAMKARRGVAAKEVLENYTGGSLGGKSRIVSGGSCGRGASSADMSNPTALAYSISWPVEEYDRAIVSGFGKESAKPEYLEAKAAAMEIQPEAGVHEELYASCDRAVATIMINTLDKTYPWGNVDTQMAYMNSSDKWEEVPMSDRQEGDILASNTGGNSHIVYFIGEGEAGENTIAQASYLGQVANIQDGSYAVNDPHYKAYRFVGTPDSTGSSLID